jgi:hypothetical protein
MILDSNSDSYPRDKESETSDDNNMNTPSEDQVCPYTLEALAV